eukprot:COSAG06_NODE_4299_length_4384_cov_5.902967_1_plen_59_part_10
MDGWIDWQQVLCPTDVWCLQRCVWHDTAALCAIVSQAAVGLCWQGKATFMTAGTAGQAG